VLTAFACFAAGLAGGILAAVAHRRRLPAHRLVAVVAGLLILAVGVLWALPAVRELAGLVPDTVQYAAFLVLILAAALIVPPLYRWLVGRSTSTQDLPRSESGIVSVGTVVMEHGDEQWPDPDVQATRPIDFARWN